MKKKKKINWIELAIGGALVVMQPELGIGELIVAHGVGLI